ncbi:unnamed protein product [Tenebrio molitor]|nr:unnamed protein product [Tenebrio molitor]
MRKCYLLTDQKMLMFTPTIHLVQEKLKPPITNTSDIEGIESDPYDPGRGGTTSATLL